jgi:hypothetical protein
VAYATVEDVMAAVAVDQPNAESEIAALRQAQQLELQLDAYHRAVATQHAANAAVIEQALQRKVEAEVARLSAEQEKYRGMLGTGVGFGSTSSAGAGHSYQQQYTPTQSSYAAGGGRHGGGLPSPVPQSSPAPSHHGHGHHQAPEVSPSTVFSGAGGSSALRQPPMQPPMTSFVSQQQEELAALRSRLTDLQSRHDEVRGVRPGHAVHISPPAPLGSRHAYGAAAHHSSADSRRSPSPEAYTTAAYAHGVPQPTPMEVSKGGGGLTRSSAGSTMQQPSSVLDRMLRKAHR